MEDQPTEWGEVPGRGDERACHDEEAGSFAGRRGGKVRVINRGELALPLSTAGGRDPAQNKDRDGMDVPGKKTFDRVREGLIPGIGVYRPGNGSSRKFRRRASSPSGHSSGWKGKRDRYGSNVVAPPGNQAANGEDKADAGADSAPFHRGKGSKTFRSEGPQELRWSS